MSKKVSIIDYGLGHLFSVRQACKTVGLDAFINADPDDILSSDMVILPGVGAYGVAMKNLEKAQIIPSLREFVKTGKPFIGICLGMQLMLSESLEFCQNFGLDFINKSFTWFEYASDSLLPRDPIIIFFLSNIIIKTSLCYIIILYL